MLLSMRQTPVNFKSNGLTLEGVITLPEGLSGPFPAAVLCHTHPLFGGNMEEPVVMALARALGVAGLASFRFNFRGVGNSQGTFSKGEKESHDLSAALDLFRGWSGINARRLALVGYSFGAQVILRGLRTFKRTQALALVSPPLSSFAHSSVATDRRPRLFLVGESDQLVGAGSLQEQVAAFSAPSTLEVIPDVDHAWRGHEEEVAERVARFLARVL